MCASRSIRACHRQRDPEGIPPGFRHHGQSQFRQGEIIPYSEAAAATQLGGGGHWPVLSGDSPLGTERAPELFRTAVFMANAGSVPSGGSPDSTGGSPVPPDSTSEFGIIEGWHIGLAEAQDSPRLHLFRVLHRRTSTSRDQGALPRRNPERSDGRRLVPASGIEPPKGVFSRVPVGGVSLLFIARRLADKSQCCQALL